MEIKTIGIIGLQRVGASVGLALQQKLSNLTILGYDPDRKVLNQAKEMGAVDKTALSMGRVAAGADLLLVALPPNEVEEAFKTIGREIQDHTVVLDMSPLKKPVQAWADKYLETGYYVGVSPIPSVEQSKDIRPTIDAADPELFQNSLFGLLPSASVDENAVETAARIGKVLGADPYFIDIEEHDIYMQAVETLPALTGAIYFHMLNSKVGWQDMKKLAGIQLLSMTQMIENAPAIADVVKQNKIATLHWLDEYINQLYELRRWIDEGENEIMSALMTDIRQRHDIWMLQRRDNDWNEIDVPEVSRQSASELLLGGLGRRLSSKDD